MGDNPAPNPATPPFRRYSDSAVLEPANLTNGISPLEDFVSANNQKNEKVNELSNNEEAGEETDNEEDDDDDDDWFSKLFPKDLVRIPTSGGTSSFPYGMNCTEIPLLCEEDLDLKEKTMRTLRVGLKKIWRRGSATITAKDPTYKVAYLGNVLTGWAKGEGCIDKPLNTLWKNYNSSSKPDVQMKITVTQSGLKAVTKDHGLIEYWSHRITYCTVPVGLPRIFCWVYRHVGRKLKQELRCHAVLCSKESIAGQMAATLRLRLSQALLEFKRDKLLRQNARLSLANSVYDNPSLPRRKILLSTGCHNYKPPLERSKSAPKLIPIEESLEEEESTPKAKRKLYDNQEGDLSDEEEKVGEEEEVNKREKESQTKKPGTDEKCEYKLTNLNFVKKLCSSIETLVDNTSNYRKKFLTERKLSKDFYLTFKKPEESIQKKVNLEEENKDNRKMKMKKNVGFNNNYFNGLEYVKCTEFKKLEEDDAKNQKLNFEAPQEIKDQESDEGSNSLQSISSCCSDVSSVVTNSSDKSLEPPIKLEEDFVLESKDCVNGYEAPMEILQTYLNNYNKIFLDDASKELEQERGNSLEEDSLCEEGDGREEDVVSDESGYVELGENLSKRLNLDSKEKDLPYHKIIKSTMLRPGRTKTSCLHV